MSSFTPSVDCPGCGAYNSINDHECWQCFRFFGEAELRDRYEAVLRRVKR